MKLADLDRHPGGNFPLQLVVRWLDTLTRSPSVTWAPGQLAAAQEAVTQARELLATDIATLAGRTSVARDAAPKTRAQVLAAIDRAEEETAAAIRAQEAQPPAMALLPGFCRCGVEVLQCHPECPHRPRRQFTTPVARIRMHPEPQEARDKYAEPEAPAEHGERLEGALRAAAVGSGGTGRVAEFGPVEHDPLLQLAGDRCLCARCVKDRQESQA